MRRLGGLGLFTHCSGSHSTAIRATLANTDWYVEPREQFGDLQTSDPRGSEPCCIAETVSQFFLASGVLRDLKVLLV